MSIKEDIAEIEGLAEKLKNEIEIWFERHFIVTPGTGTHTLQAQAKADLHDALGTAEPQQATPPVITPAPAPEADNAKPA